MRSPVSFLLVFLLSAVMPSLRGAPGCSGYDTQFALPSGTNGPVYATLVKGTDIYVGGTFSAVGGIAANNLAKFDTTTGTWSVIGTGGGNGVSYTVLALAFVGNDLYVAGSFSSANVGGTTVSANQIAKVNVQTGVWSAVSGGPVFINAMAANGTDLYVGGGFTVVNGSTAANYIAKLDTTTGAWSTLGSGGGNGVNSSVNALAIVGGDIYAGGLFTSANTGGTIVSASRVARFNIATSTWSAVGSGGGNGVSGPVNALALIGVNLYVGGGFSSANNGGTTVTVANLARFNTSANTWSAVASGAGNGVDNAVRTLAVSGNNLYLGGDFLNANIGAPLSANRVAQFDTSSNAWSALASGAGNGVDATVRALALVGTDVYVGGDFNLANIGGTIASTKGLAKFKTSDNSWNVVGLTSGNGVNGRVYASVTSGTNVYVGGDFTLAGNVRASGVAKFDTATNTWSALGNGGGTGVNGTVYALLLDGDNLFVGGNFALANIDGATVSARSIARFNTTSGAWSSLGTSGNGVDNVVRALALSGSDLYVGGDFLNANIGASIAAKRIAKFNTSSGSWSSLGNGGGNGVDNVVRALVVSGTDLYVGGDFLNANSGANVAANRLAKFNSSTSTWSALGTGGGNGVSYVANSTVNALALSGSDLYVGGIFNTANTGGTNLNANNLAKVNTGTGAWSIVGGCCGSGVTSTNGYQAVVYSLLVNGNDLYLGGHFQNGDFPTNVATSRLARVNLQNNNWSAIPDVSGGNGAIAGDQVFGVYAIALSGADLFFGGNFSAVGDTKPSAGIARVCNRAPTITPGASVSPTQSTTTNNVNLAKISDDISGGNLTFNITAPTGITFSNLVVSNGNLNATMTATCAAPLGQQNVSIQVSDGTLSATTNFSVTVLDREINLKGLGNSIADGSTTPSASNGTDFGVVAVTGGTVARTFTIESTGSSSLTISAITVTGANASDFALSGITLPATMSPGTSKTFTITFDPSATGTRAATVNIANDDCDESPYDFAIQGIGANADYSVTTSGGVLVVTDNSGNGDTLAISEPSAGQIKFAAAGRGFLVNNTTLLSGDSGAVSLSGVTSITINEGNGNDTLNVSAFTGTLPKLTINGDAGNDTINFNGSITFAANQNLDLNLQNDSASPGTDSINLAAGAQLITSGSGTIDLRASRNVSLGANARLQTQDGNLTVQANQQTTTTVGDFSGVMISGGVLQTTGTGAIDISGKGGTGSGARNIGVRVEAGGKITASGAGNISITGLGGTGTTDNYGVSVDGLNASSTAISAVSGTISITGTATDTTGTDQDGVRFENSTGAQSTAINITGAGQLMITGAAGNNDATSSAISLVDDTVMSLGTASATFIADTMDIGASNITITDASTTFKVRTAGRTLDLGGADSASALGLTSSELAHFTCATLNLGDAANTGSIVVNAAITRAAATNLNLLTNSNGPIAINPTGSLDSHGGNVVLSPHGSVGFTPGGNGVDLNMSSTGTVSFPAGTNFSVAINGSTADTQYQRLNLIGKVDLAGCTLVLSGSPTISSETKFTIVNNDGTDAVLGTFAGLPEGTIINNFLGTGKTASITYVGGDGNDVVITSPSAAPTVDVAGPLTRQQNATAINSVIATVSDPHGAAGDLIVTTPTVPAGISVTNIVNSNGTVTADVAASCTAKPGDNTVVVRASNGAYENQGSLVVKINAPEVNVTGNNIAIPAGSNAPNTSDGTDFGATATSVTKTFKIENSGNVSLTISGITLSGANPGDFTVGNIALPATIAAGGSASFTVTFNAGDDGARTASVAVANTDCDEGAYSFAIKATALSADYSITTAGGAMIVTDLIGHDDYLFVYEPEPGHIDFNASGLVFSVDGIRVPDDSGSLTLEGISSIMVNTGSGADFIDMENFSTPLPSLTINGDAEDDFVYLAGLTFAPDANLDLNLQNDSAAPGSDIIQFYNLVLSGTGAAEMRSSSTIYVDGPLQTENGSITIEANQQDSPTSGNSSAVVIYGAVQSTGSGDITIKGRGLDTGSDNAGIEVWGTIQGGTSGAVKVTGQGGGDATGQRNRGVYLNGGQIISDGANIEVTGTGPDNSKGINPGVALLEGAQITASGTGAVVVQGTGGLAGANNLGYSDGVYLASTDTKISSENGNLTVTGTSSAPVGSSFNYGICLGRQGSGPGTAKISAGGSGALTLNGNATHASDEGVFIDYNSSVSAAGGAMQITATGSRGLLLLSQGAISNPSGDITLIGDRLALQGPIAAGTHVVTLRQKTDGLALDLGGNALSPGLHLFDVDLDKITCGTLNIGDANSGTLTVSQPITRPASTNVNLTSSGDVNFNFSLSSGGGSVTVTPGLNHKVSAATPGNDVAMSATGLLSFANSPTLSLIINTTSQYDQLGVAGQVNLTGVGLEFQGTPTISGTPTFIIVNNDGADPVVGIFTGLPEGAVLSNFAGSGRSGVISYHGGDGNDVTIAISAVSPAEIAVEQPAGTDLMNNSSTIDFGNVPNGDTSGAKTFTIRNLGNANLTGVAASKDGTNNGDFTLNTGGMNTTVTGGSSTTFTVTFVPSATGTRTATLHIASNDTDENPFNIALTGRSLTLAESWRQQYFGSPDNTGNGADNANPDGDSLTNLLERAFGTNPIVNQTNVVSYNGNTIVPGSPTVMITNTEYSVDYRALYSRRKDYVAAGLSYVVQFSADLNTWVDNTAGPTVMADDGVLQAVTVPYPFFINGHKARFFRVAVTQE